MRGAAGCGRAGCGRAAPPSAVRRHGRDRCRAVAQCGAGRAPRVRRAGPARVSGAERGRTGPVSAAPPPGRPRGAGERRGLGAGRGRRAPKGSAPWEGAPPPPHPLARPPRRSLPPSSGRAAGPGRCLRVVPWSCRAARGSRPRRRRRSPRGVAGAEPGRGRPVRSLPVLSGLRCPVIARRCGPPGITKRGTYFYFQALRVQPEFFVPMAAANSTPPGSLDLSQPGFAKEILGTKLEVKYLCSDCRNILRRPFQAQCGHRYCSYCLKKIISSGPQKCASCIQEGIYEEGISILETSSAFPDNAARREVESLPAVCINEGCTWKGTIKEYESCHEGNCPFLLIECQACRGVIPLNEKERHSERECPERTLNCKYCKSLFYFPDIKAHDEVCPKFPLTCDGCGKKKIPREKFQDHVKNCGKCKVPCRFKVVGCAEMVENEKLPEHESKCLAEHLYMLLSFVLSLKSGSGDLKHLPAIPSSQSSSPLLAANSLCPESELFKSLELLGRCDALEKKTVTFENIVCVLNREVERVSLTAEAYSRQHRLDQEQIETLSNKVRQLERSIGLKDLAMAEMEEKIRNMEASTYDGVFIWKITEFARKRQEAITGRSPAIFSPAFYTSKYGYKMCLRVYLNGDGTGRGTHLSLFFVVMKGPNDALLRWPFNQKVTLMLLDQNNREHIIDAFRPDVTSSSFQRPVTEMNIASGCPLFCPVSVMEAKNSYVRDDAIFIKAIVDLSGL